MVSLRIHLIGIVVVLLLLPGHAWGQYPRVQQLAEQLRNPEPGVRRQVAIALGRAGFAPSVALLDDAMDEEADVSVRLEIVRALRYIVFQRSAGYPAAMQALARACDHEHQPDELVRLRANEALWEAAKRNMLDPVAYLERSLADPSLRLRLSAVAMLRRHGTPEVIGPLGRAATDRSQHETIRLKAAEALGAVALSDPGPVGRDVARANIRTTSLVNVPPLHPPGLLEQRHRRQIFLLAAIVDDDSNSSALRLQAVRSMGRVKDKAAVPVLSRIVQSHADDAVRNRAALVLSHLLARQYE